MVGEKGESAWSSVARKSGQMGDLLAQREGLGQKNKVEPDRGRRSSVLTYHSLVSRHVYAHAHMYAHIQQRERERENHLKYHNEDIIMNGTHTSWCSVIKLHCIQ